MVVPGPVLLFDGDCGLCVHCVKLLLKADRRRRLCFAALQGKPAQSFLRERGLAGMDFDSVVFVSEWARRLDTTPLFGTDALFAAMRTAGGMWRMVVWLEVLPRVWRDRVYCWVARRRHRFFGSGGFAALLEIGRAHV